MANPQEFSYENNFKISFLSDEFKTLDNSAVTTNVPSITIGQSEQDTPIKIIYIPGDNLEIGDLNVEFQLDEDYTNYFIVFDWLNKLKDFDEVKAQRLVIDVGINLLDNKFNFLKTIVLEDCFPISLSEIPLGVRIDSNEPITFTVSFVINNIRLDDQL